MKKTCKLQNKLLIYILCFVIGILVVFWIFEVAFLSLFYENVKISETKKVVNDIVDLYDSDELEDFMRSIAIQNDMCIRIISDSKDIITSSVSGCKLNKLNYNDIYYYTIKAAGNNGTFIDRNYERSLFLNSKNPNIFLIENSNVENIIYVQLTDNGHMILVNTNISPLTSTIKTLQMQIIVIGIIVIGAAIVLALYISKRIVRPIEKINEEAKKLASGKYDNTSNNEYLEANDLNKTLKKAAMDISKADKAKRDLIANVSHDLRTPLTMIGGYGQMMIDLPNEKTDENIKVIIDEATRLNYLVNDLLDYAKLQDNKIKLNIQEINISMLLANIYDTYHHINNKLHLDLIMEDDLMVNCDPNRIEQVIKNFINNAINYGNDQRVELICRKIDDKIMVAVKDYGKGIDPQDLPYIWDRYYKVDKTHVRSNIGSGIGLSIAKEILQLHNIEYGVDSKVNQGSIFYFKFNSIK